MKTKFLLIALLICTVFYAQENTEQVFRNDLDAIINDAAKGFRDIKGEFQSKSKWTNITYNYSNKSIFNTNKNAGIGYQPADYLPASKVYIQETYYFYQGFDCKVTSGKFVYDNAERIFDEIMKEKGLKKKIIKQDKMHKDKDKEIEYLDKNKRKVLGINFDLKEMICSLYVYSDLRPSDLPKYFGCLVLYNIQMNSVVSANTYYVYGKEFKGEEHLYNGILTKMDETSKRLFKKYEWKPNAGTKQIFDLLQSMNLRENGSKVDPDGNYIN